ncbi:MAG: hypothetical protein ACREVK_12760 [Gammaproteobacteria bacterium]
MNEFEQCVLGETAELFRVKSSEELRRASLRLVQQCKRRLDLVSRHLDPAVYDSAEFQDALKRLARRSRHAQIRIVILDPQPLVSGGHRVLDLAQRLSSVVHLRVPAEEHRHFNEAFLVADGTGVIYRKLSDRFQGTVNFSDRSEALELQRRFEEIWDKALPDPNFRRLGL